MEKSKLVKANEKIADAVVGGYKKIEQGVVGGYKKIENGVTGAYKKVEDGFVDKFLTHEGESVEDAKKRLDDDKLWREAKSAVSPVPNEIKKSMESSKNIGKK